MIRPHLLPVLFLLAMLASTGALAQSDDSLGGYTAMEIEAGTMKGNFATGAIEEMTGGVKIRLLSEDPEVGALPIQADSMKFSWTAGKATPTTIVMERGVKVQHPDASITAEKAEWNFDSGELVFSGNPEVNSERMKGLRGDRMVLNLKTNTFEVTQVRADQVPLQAPDKEGRTGAAGGGIRESDITDWPRLIDAIKAQAQADAPSPGKQILAQMSQQNQQLLTTLDTALLVERRADMVRLINGLLPNKGLYSPEAWADAALGDEARQLLAKDALDAAEQTRLNRLLLEAAYPFAFAKQ